MNDLFNKSQNSIRAEHSIQLYQELLESAKHIKDEYLKNVTKFHNQLSFDNINKKCYEEMYSNIEPNNAIPTNIELQEKIKGLSNLNKEAYKFFMRSRNNSVKGMDVQLGNKFDEAIIDFLQSKKINACRADKRNKKLPDIQILDKTRNIKAYIEHKYHHAPFMLSHKIIGRESYEGSITMDTIKLQKQIIECESEIPNRPVFVVHWVDFHHLKGIFFNTMEQIKDYLDVLDEGSTFNRQSKSGDYILNKKVGYTEKFYPPLHEMGDFHELLEKLS
jgi:hypothetical protein